MNASDIDCLDHKRRDYRDDSRKVFALRFVFLHDVLIFRHSHYETKQKISTHKRNSNSSRRAIPPNDDGHRIQWNNQVTACSNEDIYLSTGGYWIGPQKTWPCVFRSRPPTPPCNWITMVIVHACLMSWVRVRLMHMHLLSTLEFLIKSADDGIVLATSGVLGSRFSVTFRRWSAWTDPSGAYLPDVSFWEWRERKAG